MNKCFEFLPFHSSLVTSYAVSPSITVNHKCQLSYRTNPRERRLKNKAGSGIQCHKNVAKRQIQYTHTLLIFGSEKTKGEGQDTVISPAHIHPGFNQLHNCVYTAMKEAKPSSPKLGTLKYPTLMFLTSHQVTPKILIFRSSFKVLFLTTTP